MVAPGVATARVILEADVSVRLNGGVVETIYVGQRVLLEIEFRLYGAPADPATVRLITQSPSGEKMTVDYPVSGFTKRVDGFYEAVLVADEPGAWLYRVEGSGGVWAITEGGFQVEPSAIAPD